MRAKKVKTELRREQIIQAALDLIGIQGIQALSIVGIAERVGIVPSALYRHFKNKEEVLDGVLMLCKKRVLGNIAHVKKKTSDPLEQLQCLLIRQTRMLSENRAIPHVVFSDGVYTGPPDRKAKVAEIMAAFLAGIQDIITEGQQMGTIRGDVIPFAASVMFLGMIMPAAVISNVSEGIVDIPAHAETVWPMFLRCISNEKKDQDHN
ncbi:MAG TPA: TetR/AcrR family transcriptional regulator [Desulfobacteraceae bacterium]|nr:TetR/AcrR family transcriptional regulator [Desulfobacteraceae bacterium]